MGTIILNTLNIINYFLLLLYVTDLSNDSSWKSPNLLPSDFIFTMFWFGLVLLEICRERVNRPWLLRKRKNKTFLKEEWKQFLLLRFIIDH